VKIGLPCGGVKLKPTGKLLVKTGHTYHFTKHACRVGGVDWLASKQSCQVGRCACLLLGLPTDQVGTT
jgi:hypothetical protein